MESIREVEDKYILRLSEMKDPLEQFDYLMSLGMKMGRLVSVETDGYRIPGCRTAIWVRLDGRRIEASSDSVLVLGMLWILREMYDGRPLDEVVANPVRFPDHISEYVVYPEIRKNGIAKYYRMISSDR